MYVHMCLNMFLRICSMIMWVRQKLDLGVWGGNSMFRCVTQKWKVMIRYIGGSGQKWPKLVLRKFWRVPSVGLPSFWVYTLHGKISFAIYQVTMPSGSNSPLVSFVVGKRDMYTLLLLIYYIFNWDYYPLVRISLYIRIYR